MDQNEVFRRYLDLGAAFTSVTRERAEELMSAEGRCCLAFTPKINEWNGYRSVELEVSDFQPGAQARLG